MLPSHLEELLQWVVPINEKNKIPLTQVSEFAFVLRYLVAADAQETAIASYRMIALKVLRSFCWRNNEKGKKISVLGQKSFLITSLSTTVRKTQR